MKFKLTSETKTINNITLFRIEALKDFSNVKTGDKGGWVEKESNLSQEGNCWVFGNAQVYGDAQVYGNALVYGNAQVSGNDWVFGNARVSSTEDLICISGFQYHITITHQNIVIGCQIKTYKEWMEVTKKQAVKKGLKEEQFERVRALIKLAALKS